MGDEITNPASKRKRIIAFLCQWCTYAGADLAGSNRLKYTPDVRIIKVPCSARMNPLFVLKAFDSGADGVLVSGCHPGDCHYTKGNFYTRRRYLVFKQLLEFSGIDPRRFAVSWISAAEDKKWVDIIEGLSSDISKLEEMKLAE